MKRHLRKIASLVTALVVVTSLSVSAFASEVQTKDGFTPEADSTWGDLFRYFDPEGFEALPEEIQNQYDAALLNTEMSVSTENVISNMSEAETTISASGYLYKDTESTTGPESCSIDIAGLLNLTLGVSSTKTKIEYTAGLFCTKTCPWMYCSVTIYDGETGKYIDFDRSAELDGAKVCNVDGTFSGLESKHKYKVQAFGNVTPPAGYFISNPLYVETMQETK